MIHSLDLCPPSVFSRNVVTPVWARLVLLVMTAVLIAAVAFPLQAQPLTADLSHLYVPAMQPVTGASLGLAFVNTDAAQAEVEIAARTYDGGLVTGTNISNPVTLTVAAGAKQQLSAVDIFGSGISGRNGWIDISISSGNVKAFSLFFDSASTLIESVELTTAPSDRLIFPQVSSGSATRLSVVNTAAESVSATLSLYDNSGLLVSGSQIALPALGGFSADIRTLFSVDDGFEGYAVITAASQALSGLEVFQSQSDIAGVRGLPSSAITKTGYWAHFTNQSAFQSTITLVNPAAEAQTLQMTATFQDAGGPVSLSQTITLLPNQRLQQDVTQLFQLPEAVNGYIRFEVQSDTPGVVGILNYGTINGAMLTAAEPWTAGESIVYFAHAQDNENYFTGLALLNPGVNPAAVLVDIINSDGSVARSASLSLAPGERRAGLLSEIFQDPVDAAKGDLRILTTEPVIAVEMLGSRDGADLANMTADTQQYPSFSANASSSLSTDATFSANAASKTTPQITSLAPSSQNINGMSSLNVTINGTGFSNKSSVNYDGVRIQANFINSALLAVTLSNLSVGTHSMSVSSQGATSNTAMLTLTNQATNQAPTVSAGGNQTITASTFPASVNLSGTATDDGLPTGSVLTTTWSMFSGPGTVSFGNVNALATTATFSTAGSYVLRLTASDGSLSSTSNVTITVNTATTPGNLTISTALALDKTTVTAGQTLNATVTYKNTGSSAITVNAVVIASRPPGGTNSGGPYDDLSPALAATTVQAGATLQVSASRSFTSTDSTGVWYAYVTYQDTASAWHDGPSLNFTVSASTQQPTNQPPTVSAGGNQTITPSTFPASVNLSGTATDDGLPTGSVLTTTWSMFSGPATVSFGNVNALATTASFSTAGSYVLRLTGSDGSLSSTSNVTITVNAATTGSGGGTQPPANAFYVSTTGNDSNSGSSSSPWRTIQKAANTVSAGATVVVNAGTYNERVNISRSGTSSSPITFQTQGGSVVMQGFSISGSYVIVDGFEPSNIAANGVNPAAYAGIYSSGSNNIIRNNYSHNNGSFGVYLESTATFNQVLNNRIAYNGQVGIWTHGSDHLIQGNDVSHSIQVPANWANAPSWADADGIYIDGDRHVFKGNYIHDITLTDAGQSCASCQITLPHRDCFQADTSTSGAVVDGNICHLPSGQAWTSQMMMLSGTVTNLMVRNNIIYNTDRGPNVLGTVSGMKIENNTFVNITDYAVDLESTGGNNVLVRNNIFRNTRTPAVDVVSATATQDHNFTADPLFVNEAGLDFHLTSGSPAKDTGVNTTDVTLDYDGVSRPQGASTDIGAYEYH